MRTAGRTGKSSWELHLPSRYAQTNEQRRRRRSRLFTRGGGGGGGRGGSTSAECPQQDNDSPASERGGAGGAGWVERAPVPLRRGRLGRRRREGRGVGSGGGDPRHGAHCLGVRRSREASARVGGGVRCSLQDLSEVHAGPSFFILAAWYGRHSTFSNTHSSQTFALLSFGGCGGGHNALRRGLPAAAATATASDLGPCAPHAACACLAPRDRVLDTVSQTLAFLSEPYSGFSAEEPVTTCAAWGLGMGLWEWTAPETVGKLLPTPRHVRFLHICRQRCGVRAT